MVRIESYSKLTKAGMPPSSLQSIDFSQPVAYCDLLVSTTSL